MKSMILAHGDLHRLVQIQTSAITVHCLGVSRRVATLFHVMRTMTGTCSC
jgi:hypothetical protein